MGGKLKRPRVAYDEKTTLDRMRRTADVFDGNFLAEREGKGHPSAAPIFIIGMPRSGSTLVEQILDSHPDVYGGGELDIFGQTIRTVKSSVETKVFPEAILDWNAGDFETLGANYRTALEKAARLQGAQKLLVRITDKMLMNSSRSSQTQKSSIRCVIR